MARVKFTVSVTVDEEAVQEHVAETEGNKYPLVADPEEWTWDDLKAAVEDELAVEPEIVGAETEED